MTQSEAQSGFPRCSSGVDARAHSFPNRSRARGWNGSEVHVQLAHLLAVCVQQGV